MLFQSLDLSKIILRLLYDVKDIIILRQVTSTNQYLIDNLSYLKLGSVCIAESQTHGRGRYGKHWISPRNNNLYLSFYWFFSDYNKKKLVIMLGLVVSVVIGELLYKLGVRGIVLKWPNDIYVQGCKLAGVLVEIINRCRDYLHIIIGIGINMTSSFTYFKKGSLVISLEEMGVFIDRNILAAYVINTLYQSLMEFERFGFLPFVSRWLILDNYYNKPMKLFVKKRMFFGVSRGIDSYGSLLLEHSGSIYSYSCNENISFYFY